MRICQCGGHIRTHPLTAGRDAWTCGACGRYEVVGPRSAAPSRTNQPAPPSPLPNNPLETAL